LAIIDCSIKDPAYTCFNRLAREVEENLSYHNFPKYGLEGLSYEGEPDGIIALGSHSNIGDGSHWHSPLATYLLEQLKKGIPVFGICFTHQLMAHAFGSQLQRNAMNRCLEGVREVQLNKSLFGIEKNTLSLFTAHNYQIESLSPDLEVIGTSKDSPFEFLRHKSLPYFSCQSHPEGSEFFIKHEIKIELSIDEKEKGLKDGLYLLKKFISSI
jgi:GMP synthase-like glutamine amidotransferase